jgi:hypothetical protein
VHDRHRQGSLLRRRRGPPLALLPDDAVLARGYQIASMLAGKPELYRRLQKQTLNQRMRRRIVEGVPHGTALEGLTAAGLGRA